MTYGVVLFTLVVQGPATKVLVQWLDLIQPTQDTDRISGDPAITIAFPCDGDGPHRSTRPTVIDI